MAVYCGTCACRIDSAAENGGSFLVNVHKFKGWTCTIDDTCEECAKKLRNAVLAVANAIVVRNQAAVDARRKEREAAEKARVDAQRERAEFEQAWAARKRKQ